MKRYHVIITPSAQDDIREAHEWLMAENAAYAGKWLDGIREKILGLATLPESHAWTGAAIGFAAERRSPTQRAASGVKLIGRTVLWRRSPSRLDSLALYHASSCRRVQGRRVASERVWGSSPP